MTVRNVEFAAPARSLNVFLRNLPFRLSASLFIQSPPDPMLARACRSSFFSDRKYLKSTRQRQGTREAVVKVQ